MYSTQERTMQGLAQVPGPGIWVEALTAYLEDRLGRPAAVVSLRPLLGAGESVDPKGFGYGTPIEVECVVGGASRTFVVARTRPAEGFGHDYPADRAWQALYAHGAYNDFPCHVRSVDVGVIRASGELDSVADAVEFFQLVEKAEGTPYWLDLERLLDAPARELDTARARELASFLASVHAGKTSRPATYQRRIRELVGHGECLMGILDSYPHPYRLLPPAECEELERLAIGWRWRLRDRHHRLSRTHGDFHPWNLLFRDGVNFWVLDRSRGEWGEPADDVAALGINYLFYGVRAQAGCGESGASQDFLDLFRIFLDTYLGKSGDSELLEVLPPFLGFRALVVAHPRWYPTLSDGTRRTLLGFARAMLAPAPFELAAAERLLGGGR
jgi:hypothetical protein